MNFYKTTILATGSALILSSALSVIADEHDGNIYINPALGLQEFDDGKRNLRQKLFKSLGIEYRFNKNWAVDLNGMDSSPDVRHGGGEVDLRQYSIDGMYYFDREDDSARFQPYSAIGLGHADFEGVTDETETQARFGLGMRYELTDHWSLKADAKLLYGVDDDTMDKLMSLGLSYAFKNKNRTAAPVINTPVDGDADQDGVNDSQDQCPNTSAGASVDSNGCALDSDQDGVADYRDQCPETPVGRQVDENGCKHVLTSTEEVALNVQFPSNSSVVDKSYNNELKKVADFLSKYGAVSAVIEGHTDDTGEAEYNEVLSQRRANAVMNALVERFNIDASRLTAKGYGEASPIVDNGTAEGRRTNRRVVAVMKAEVSE